jgi:uncharacterized protein YndB with AHSA1/START domain
MTSTAPKRDGQLIELAGDRVGVRFERRLGHSPERVWRAITEPAELAKWFPADIEGDLMTAGAELRFPFREGEAETESGEVIETDPPWVLDFTWGGQSLRFELEPDGDGTRLTFTHALPREETAQVAAGWELRLGALEDVLDGRQPPDDFDEDRWVEVHADYAERFGVDPGRGLATMREVKERAEKHRG